MSATDATQIDPGDGYRLLQVGEVKPDGYEVDMGEGWEIGYWPGTVVRHGDFLARVKITPKPFSQNKYARSLVTLDGRTVPVDVYAVLDAFHPSSSAVQHAVKKLLAPGQRGHKTSLEDLREARASIDRAIQAEEAAQ